MTYEVNSKSKVDISIKNKGCASSEMTMRRSCALGKSGRPQLLSYLECATPKQDTSSFDGGFLTLRRSPGVRFSLVSFLISSSMMLETLRSASN